MDLGMTGLVTRTCEGRYMRRLKARATMRRMHCQKGVAGKLLRGKTFADAHSDDVQARIELVAVGLERVFQVVVQTVEVVDKHLLRKRHTYAG